MTDINVAMKSYLDAIIADYDEFQGVFDKSEVKRRMFDEFVEGLKYKVGRKYIKVLREGGGVHSFIVNCDDDKKFKRGDILKPAGWATPARNQARGNIFEAFSVRWTGPHYLR